jgi:macrodomain Ter protein organizer (MatP/YcbG family)
MQASSQTEMADQKKKLIKIDPEVHRKLTELASWGDTLSDIIDMLIDEHNARVKERKQQK